MLLGITDLREVSLDFSSHHGPGLSTLDHNQKSQQEVALSQTQLGLNLMVAPLPGCLGSFNVTITKSMGWVIYKVTSFTWLVILGAGGPNSMVQHPGEGPRMCHSMAEKRTVKQHGHKGPAL